VSVFAANPVISGLWPNYGPLSGATAITVYGSTPSAFQPTGLYIGSHRFAVLTYRYNIHSAALLLTVVCKGEYIKMVHSSS